MSLLNAGDFEISKLGPCKFVSPLKDLDVCKECEVHFVGDQERVLFESRTEIFANFAKSCNPMPSLELAGPRSQIYFDPAKTRAAIVTCGGLCPGINDVIRALVMELHYRYGMKEILGIKYGYQGFIPEYGHPRVSLTPEAVVDIHNWGGTTLGTSRGPQNTERIVDEIQKRNIQILFVVGGDGTMRAALEISQLSRKRKIALSVVGIPKTIDNDILYIDQSFGFDTAFSESVKAIASANTEALGSPNCIGLVQLMGRHSGFIACYATLAMNDVNYVFIPEMPFEFDGPKGFLAHLKARMLRRRHAVIVVAEGCGQEHLKGKVETDLSGNVRLKDIGLYFKERIVKYFAEEKMEINLKYIDPSYMIRSIPATPQDSVYCGRLAQNAVHAAMSGRTEMVVGLRHSEYVHLPMPLISKGRKRVDSDGDLWYSVLEATGQPARFVND